MGRRNGFGTRVAPRAESAACPCSTSAIFTPVVLDDHVADNLESGASPSPTAEWRSGQRHASLPSCTRLGGWAGGRAIVRSGLRGVCARLVVLGCLHATRRMWECKMAKGRPFSCVQHGLSREDKQPSRDSECISSKQRRIGR